MRRVLIGGALGVLVVWLAACGSSSSKSASEQAMQHRADLWSIDQIEKNFHKATSTQDIDLMMSLWAPHATFTYGPGETATGKRQIRQAWLIENKNFWPEFDKVSETLAYKVRVTASGDRGTLYFECHYLDLKTHKLGPLTGADLDVARINGRWLITSLVGSSATLSR
jgi:ketosteroid isomerase-like protein